MMNKLAQRAFLLALILFASACKSPDYSKPLIEVKEALVTIEADYKPREGLGGKVVAPAMKPYGDEKLNEEERKQALSVIAKAKEILDRIIKDTRGQ